MCNELEITQCFFSLSLSLNVDTASAGHPTHTQPCLVQIRSSARRPHTWACLRRKRAWAGGAPCACRLAPPCLASCAPGLASHCGGCAAGKSMSPKRGRKKEGRTVTKREREKHIYSPSLSLSTALYMSLSFYWVTNYYVILFDN